MHANVTTARGHALLLAATSGLILLAHTAPVAAEEQTLRFKLVTQQLGEPRELPEIGGHKVSVGEYMGVAVFEDGRIAHKRFVDVSDDTAQAGTFKGYSTYTFQAGDSLTLSYTGGWDDKGAKGVYQVISGTARIGGQDIVITDGRIRDERLSFTLWHAQHARPPVRFVAMVQGNILRGTCQNSDDPPMAWGGMRARTPTDPRLH